MGQRVSYNKEPIPVGTVGTIVHDQYSTYNEIDPVEMHIGTRAKVVKSGYLMKSRPDLPNVSYCTVMFQNGSKEAYFTTNLKH
jgi:hypothetical protein